MYGGRKIEHALVKQLDDTSTRPQWLEGLAALLGAIPLQVIAEGIESEAQAAALEAAGVQLAQGHWLSPPLPAKELERYYAASRAEH